MKKGYLGRIGTTPTVVIADDVNEAIEKFKKNSFGKHWEFNHVSKIQIIE